MTADPIQGYSTDFEPTAEGTRVVGEFVFHDGHWWYAGRVGSPEADPIECAICGDYSSQGVEVHAVCLEMLSRSVSVLPGDTAPGGEG